MQAGGKASGVPTHRETVPTLPVGAVSNRTASAPPFILPPLTPLAPLVKGEPMQAGGKANGVPTHRESGRCGF